MIKDIFQRYLEQTKVDVIANYDRLGLRASGKFADGMEVKVSDTGKALHGEILSEGHGWFLEKGRSPNKKATKGQIYFMSKILEEWAKDKGIVLGSPWMAAKKIVEKGIQVPNAHNKGTVFSDVINDKWEDELLNRLGTYYIKLIKTDIETNLKTLIQK
jgi:hypothetical protein